MTQVVKYKNNFEKLNFFLLIFLPVSLLIGSFISNLTVVLICIIFIVDLVKKKNIFFFKDINFYFLLCIYFYLILNSIFLSQNIIESSSRSFGFIRFILLSYAVYYYFLKFKKDFLKYWTLILIVVSIDILFEFIFGHNILGFSSTYTGRIASFTGDELKIGGFYFGFFVLILFYIFNYKKNLYLIFSIFFLITSLLIGEKANFLKILIIFVIFNYFFLNFKTFIKLLLILVFAISSILFVNINKHLKSSFLADLPVFKNVKIVTQYIYPEIFANNKGETRNEFIVNFKFSRHYSHYVTAYQIFKKNLIFGTGLKNFRYESYKSEYEKGGTKGGSTHPHQIHFEFLSELGLVGYILILSNFIYNLFRQSRNTNPLKYIGISFILVTLIPLIPSGSFFTSFSATIFFINYSFLIFLNKGEYIK